MPITYPSTIPITANRPGTLWAMSAIAFRALRTTVDAADALALHVADVLDVTLAIALERVIVVCDRQIQHSGIATTLAEGLLLEWRVPFRPTEAVPMENADELELLRSLAGKLPRCDACQDWATIGMPSTSPRSWCDACSLRHIPARAREVTAVDLPWAAEVRALRGQGTLVPYATDAELDRVDRDPDAFGLTDTIRKLIRELRAFRALSGDAGVR